jgi:hypothetical protein
LDNFSVVLLKVILGFFCEFVEVFLLDVLLGVALGVESVHTVFQYLEVNDPGDQLASSRDDDNPGGSLAQPLLPAQLQLR